MNFGKLFSFGPLIAAMHGYNFCTASRKAFNLLVNNVIRVAAINSVGDFVLFLAKVTIVTLTVLLGIVILQVGDSFKTWGIGHNV